MKLAIMQPYFFPYLGYYQAIHAVDKYILYDNLTYIKEGWMNRNRYLVVNGDPAYFIVEVKKKSSFSKIRDIQLADNPWWRKKILKSIFYSYKPSPFFDEIYPLVERVLNAEVSFLTELNSKSIIEVCNYLDIKTEINTDTSRYLQLEEKLSNDGLEISARFPSIKLDDPEKKVIRVIEICRKEGAEIFINAIGGRDLYNKEEFESSGIKLLFIQTNPYSYKQPSKIFYPHLSIIDVLMNCGKDTTKKLLNEYTLL
ncbi:MAG: WbqC family protein [Chloroflexi bacterium]|nr:WbqC family protein [Chloroflexota bacterium]